MNNYENIKNLASALEKCGFEVEIWWDANWYCTDNKAHYGIELFINCGEEDISFIFNRKGQRINSCTEGELK